MFFHDHGTIPEGKQNVDWKVRSITSRFWRLVKGLACLSFALVSSIHSALAPGFSPRVSE